MHVLYRDKEAAHTQKPFVGVNVTRFGCTKQHIINFFFDVRELVKVTNQRSKFMSC